MDLQARVPRQRDALRHEAKPAAQPAPAPAGLDTRPGAVVLRKLADAMHDSPRMAAQRALAETIHGSPRVAVQRALGNAMADRTAQRQGGLQDEELLQGKLAPVQRAESEINSVARPNDTNFLSRLGFNTIGAQAGSPAAQRMTVDGMGMAPEEVFESIKNSRNGQKFIKARGEEALLRWLGIRNSFTYSRSQLQEAVKSAASEKTGSLDSKEKEVERGLEFVGPSVAEVLQDGRKAEEVYYKVGLCMQLEDSKAYLQPFAQRMVELANAFTMGAPIERAGIQRTFDLLTTNWPYPPSYYLNGKGRDNLTGGKKGGGVPLAFSGINSELDAILGVPPEELAEGEVVFNASNYADPEVAEMTKDVDVSYIDGAGVLHLIESAKDMNALQNKVVGKHAQKTIYEHLTKTAASIEHTAAGPLTPQQAERNAITDVAWWYNVPPETLSLDTENEDIRNSIAAMASAGAGLRSGNRRWTPQDIRELL